MGILNSPAHDADATGQAPAGASPEGRAGDDTLERRARRLIEDSLDAGESDLLKRVLAATVTAAFERNGTNQVRAAAALGISRNELRTHLAHLGLIAGRPSRRRA